MLQVASECKTDYLLMFDVCLPHNVDELMTVRSIFRALIVTEHQRQINTYNYG